MRARDVTSDKPSGNSKTETDNKRREDPAHGFETDYGAHNSGSQDAR
jgi:hypothetical protein